ncbi:MAG: helix-turn-helix transcriptional regulator [Gammaproteobacteria bacterium]|nr:helix-turn-helix transcriptional regulator [Gammaproteobacteria bacterium]
MNSLSDRQIEYIARTKKARASTSFDQKQVADYIGVARNTYTAYEIDRPMPQKYQNKFCEFIDVEEKWLISGNGNMRKNSEVDEAFEQIQSAWQGFDDVYKEELANFTRDLKNIQSRKNKLKSK